MFLGLKRGLLKSLLQLIHFFAQLGKRLLCWIGFLICLLGGAEIGFHCSVVLEPATVLGGVRGMRTPMFLAKLTGLLDADFLGNLLCSSSTGPLGSCHALLMLSCRITHVLNSLERSLKRTHVHGSHPFLVEVVLILPLVRTHPESMTCQISLDERNICQCHNGIVAWAVVPAGQLRNIGIELLYVLYKLTYANPLGLLEHLTLEMVLCPILWGINLSHMYAPEDR